MEQINIRLTTDDQDEVIEEFLTHIRQLRNESAIRAITVCRHGTLETDFCVLIEIDRSDQLPPDEAVLRLVAGLKSIGVIHHTRWTLTEQWRR